MAHPMALPQPAEDTALLRPDDPDREMVAALLGFVAYGLAYGSTLEEMQAIALDELERARQLAAKQRRRKFDPDVREYQPDRFPEPDATRHWQRNLACAPTI
jgi:hypothetical protein